MADIHVTTKDGHRYMLRPIDSGTCWRVYKHTDKEYGRNGEPIKHPWQALEKYACTVEYGLRLINEMAMKESGEEVAVTCGDCSHCKLEEFLGQIEIVKEA